MTEMINPEGSSQAADVRGSARQDASRFVRYGLFGLLAVAFAAMLVGVQATLFYQMFTPRVTQANRLLFDLVVEGSQRDLYQRITAQVEELRKSGATEDQSAKLTNAWNDFHNHFATAPDEEFEELRTELTAFGTVTAGSAASVAQLRDDLQRLQVIYTDRYKPLLEEIENPPFYLWPSAYFLANHSGYRDAITLNHTLHLAQVGEVGTARVMLTGLRASTEDPQMLGLIYYMLGRLQFELFRSRPEAEFYTQSVQYLRQSLRADPDSPLAKHFIDYLLSLSQGQAAPRAGEGQPTTPSEGEGAAISADKRRF